MGRTGPSRSSLVPGEQLGQVQRAHVRAAAAESPAHLHEAARVARDDAGGARRLDVPDLLVEDLRGDLRQADRERAAEAAALVGARQLDQLRAVEVLQQNARRLRLVEPSQEMAGVVI